MSIDDDNGWSGITFFLDEFAGEEIDTIGLEFLSSDGTTNYDVRVGNIRVHEGDPLTLSVDDIVQATNDVQVYYALNRDNPITLEINWPSDVSYELYSIDGKLVAQDIISQQEQSSYILPTSTMASGVYLLRIGDEETQITKKLTVK